MALVSGIEMRTRFFNGRPLTKHCKNGHILTPDKVGFFKRKRDGYVCYVCKECRSEREKLRYKTDETFRINQIEKAKARYHRVVENGMGQIS